MKTLTLATIVACLNLTTTAYAQIQETQPVSETARMDSISVPTVKCGQCVKAITRTLESVKDIQLIKVDKDAKIAIVQYDSEKTSRSDIEKAISMAGYDAGKTKRDRDAYDKLPGCCK